MNAICRWCGRTDCDDPSTSKYEPCESATDLDGGDRTPRLEAVEPTPAQWVAEFLDATAYDRVLIAKQVLRAARVARNCYEQDHAGLFAERNRWASQLASANDRADAAEYAKYVAEANLAQFEYEMLSGKDQE